MLDANYLFLQAKYPLGTQGETSLLLRFHPQGLSTKRRLLNLALVIDRSGSMAGQDLKYALDAAQTVIDQLEATDRVSVVVFDDQVDTIIAPQLVTDKEAIKSKIRQIRAGGTTNLSGGWLEGCKHIKAHYDPQAVNRVLLLTDGQANEGITNTDALIKYAAQKNAEGIVTTTLGFGSWFNEDLLVGMARSGGGNFYFIQNKNEATSVFNLELESLKSIVAQNLTVSLQAQAGVQLQQLLTARPVEKTGETWQVNLGDVLADEDKVLGVVLTLPEFKQVGDVPVLNTHYSADLLQAQGIQPLNATLTIHASVSTLEEAAEAGSTGVLVQLAHLKIANAKTHSLALQDQGAHAKAKQILLEVIDELRRQGLHEKFEIAEEIEQLQYFAQRIASKDVTAETRKELADQAFQGLSRSRRDLAARGTEVGQALNALPVVQAVGEGIELLCVREGGKLRVHVANDPRFDSHSNIQFPRAIRADGARYLVKELEPSSDGSFYRVKGEIQRLVKAGQADPFAARSSRSSHKTGKASKSSLTLADLEVTHSIGDGVLVQCVKAGSKLRARVVSDGYEPTWNMRFPRAIRQEGILYVVDEILTAGDGKSYIACGTIKRFEQV